MGEKRSLNFVAARSPDEHADMMDVFIGRYFQYSTGAQMTKLEGFEALAQSIDYGNALINAVQHQMNR